MSALSAFTNQLVQFFEELCSSFPEERDIKMATEAIRGAKKINPRLLLDLFREHVYKDAAQAIHARDFHQVRMYAQKKVEHQFNDMTCALSLFDKHWESMGESNQEVIWQYLKVLCLLCEKALRD
jgi:uncharacterized protein YozE (UPF0346 family)